MENSKVVAPPEDGQDVASSDNSFAEIYSQYEQEHHATAAGQAIEGTVVSVTPDAIFVDIGRKMEGAVPADQVRGEDGEITLTPGSPILVTVRGREADGTYSLSTVKVERPRDWSALEAAFSQGQTIGGTVMELIKGGLRVDVGARAFMPASRSGARDQAEMERLLGQEIRCKIIKLDTASEDVVVDRRAVLEQEAAEAKQNAFSALQEGVVVHGVVRTITDFGAFVDIGGVDGLLHVADMAWRRVEKPSDVVQPGDDIEVKILKINRTTHRISLGLKQLQPDPWSLAAERFNVGDRVQGTVTRLTDFGAFVELMPGVEGLIHVSEMSWSKKVRKPSDLLSAGENVEAVVLAVNAAEKRISLGLKQALGDPWEEAEKKYRPGAVVEAPVTSLAKFGAFVDLGNGIEGMIHISDISREKRINHPREALQTGQTVKAVVLEMDRSKKRIKLGMKQLEPTRSDEFIAEHKPGDTVTGRISEVLNGRARVDLGEGVFGECRLESKPAGPAETPQPAGDLSSMTARLAAAWKQGGAAQETEQRARTGQVRQFRIASLDAAAKRIDLELLD